TLKMEIQDTINYPSHPGKFNNGVTNIRCISKITLEKGKTSFELNHTIQNTKAQTVTFEYWTCATFAPGSEPGNTFTPANSEIIAPIDYVYLKDDWWSWMGDAEEPAIGQGNHVFEYKNLAIYENWEDMGIAYAFPFIDQNYYGVINHENEEGVFRVANNAMITKGMKFWTWGSEQGLNADPLDFYDIARPYIELWSGLSTQFFEDTYLSPDESISWTETYLPTIDMGSVNNVNENGAIYVAHVKEGEEEWVKTNIFATTPDTEFNLYVNLQGTGNIELFDGSFISDSDISSEHSFRLGDYLIEDGDYILSASITNDLGELIIESSIPVTIPIPPYGIDEPVQSRPKVYLLSDNTCRIEFEDGSNRIISVFAVNGQLVKEEHISGNTATFRVRQSGLYIIRITEADRTYSLKIII
ncbi:MAG TPA: T9SS type A sorting domain-containing protein, partial [Bacteroidales bacterium]|nr:T9SS type A sorting domain-containing protein [Bacteroidales bacterium]